MRSKSSRPCGTTYIFFAGLDLVAYMEHDIGVVIALSRVMLFLYRYLTKAAVNTAGENETDLN